MISYAYKVDMVPGANQGKTVVYLNQYDTDFSIVFELFARIGTFTIESGTTAAIRGTKPDGNGYSADATIDIENKTVTVFGAEQMTVCAGTTPYELVLYNDGKELNTANFDLYIERAALDKDTPASHSETRELVEIEAHATEIIAAAEGVTEAAATVSSLSETIAADAQTAEDAAALARRIASSLPDEQEFADYVIDNLLLSDMIVGTTQTITKDSNGRVTAVAHTKNGAVQRTDTFTYEANAITEERTLATGEVLTITTNLTTLAETITRTNAA